ncbi:hypothetical protein V6N11_047339 [Hibiscus sabdariffa]|uniref:Uncharacterized protein n=2 Tax=Hibiscus sabdariffa TaxID=183260 RepID=A0ABR2PC51_9ROSI
MQSRVDEASRTKLAPPRGTLNRKATPRRILNVHHHGHRQESGKCIKEGEGLGGNRKEREADEKGERGKTERISESSSR